MHTNRKIAEPIVAITGGEGLEGDHLKAALDMLPMQRMIKPAKNTDARYST